MLMLVDPAEGKIEGQNLLFRNVAPNDITRTTENSGLDYISVLSYLLVLILPDNEYPVW
jgi:hypothetical protein